MDGQHQPMNGQHRPHLDPAVESLVSLEDRQGQDQESLASLDHQALRLPSGLVTGHGFPTLLPQESQESLVVPRVAKDRQAHLLILGASHHVIADGVNHHPHRLLGSLARVVDVVCHQENLASLVDHQALPMTVTADGVSHHGASHQAPAAESQARVVARAVESLASLVEAALVKMAGMDGVSHQDGEDGAHQAQAAESQERVEEDQENLASLVDHQALLLPTGVLRHVIARHHHQESLASLVDHQVLLPMTATADGVSHHGASHQAQAVESQARVVDHQALLLVIGADGASHHGASHQAQAVESLARVADVNKHFHHPSPSYFAP